MTTMVLSVMEIFSKYCNVMLMLILYAQIVFIYSGLVEAEDVVKCVQYNKEKVRIGCPQGHVIYKPAIEAGASSSQSCTRDVTYCTGIPRRLERQVNKCFWKKSCTLTITNSDTIECGNHVESFRQNISYVVFKKMYCIPKELVTDICRLKYKKDNQNTIIGVIRSHKTFPVRPHRKSRDQCQVTLPVGRSMSMFLEVLGSGKTSTSALEIIAVSRLDASQRVLRFDDRVWLHGNTTQAVVITSNVVEKLSNGFAVAFNGYKTKTLTKYLQWPNASRPALRELGWIFEVRPVLEQCAGATGGRMELQCGPGEVIYFPAVSASGYSRKQHPKCSFSKYSCGGLSSDLIVQENNCYWNNSCTIQWRPSSRIVMSKETQCIGYTLSTVGLTGHRCVHKRNIHDICTDRSGTINSDWGIIRSHSQYPWFVGSKCSEYNRDIKIGKRRALNLAIQDINMDPEGRDKFHVYHVTRTGSRELLNWKTAMEGSNKKVKGGQLRIRYKRTRRSKSGRGFVLVFHRFSVTDGASMNSKLASSSLHKSGVVNDATSAMTYRLSNRRLCSQRGKKRKRGKACHKRVWTDYYKRLA